MRETTATKTVVETTELEFTSMNSLRDTLDYIEAMSPRELLANLRKIKHPVRILNIYSYGSIHIAWIMTHAKIKKTKGD